MGTSEKFCLRWNDFENNISVAFREIREEKDFFDCTLSCGSRQVQAHKLILSACSPFFRTVLRQNPHQHPLIYLKGVEFVDLQSVLNFMYHGEVNVAQEELNTFLAVAEDLQVKGLTQNDKDCNNPSEASKPESKSKVQYASSSIKAPSKVSEHQASQRSRQQPVVASCTEPSPSQESEDILELPAVKQEPQPMVSYPPSGYHDDRSQVANIDDSYVEGGYEDYGEYEDSALYSGSGMTGQGDLSSRGFDHSRVYEDGTAQCMICQKVFGRKDNCFRHVTTVHLEDSTTVSCNCAICGKTFKNDQSLKTHMRVLHNIYNTK